MNSTMFYFRVPVKHRGKFFIEKIRNGKAFFFILIFATTTTFSQTQTRNLSGEPKSTWQFRKAGDSKWLSATVPGTVHTDLFSNKIIDDPFFGDNEKKLQWIDTCRWEYQTSFNCDSTLLANRHVELQFDGLDTYAKVFLNDNLILITDNMFRTWFVSCKSFLKEKDNHLVIQFESASKKGKELARSLPYTLPGDEKVFTRKAAYQYGWDWAPRFVTCGIWKPVKLNWWNFFKINDIHIVQDEVSDTSATMVAEVNVKTVEPTTVYFKMKLENADQDSMYFEQPIRPGENTLNLLFKVKNPKRWWCNGMGEPFVYHLSIQCSNVFAKSEVKKLTFGIRTVQVAQDYDSLGRSFSFSLNGVPVFMKGANYVPADNFLPRVNEKRYSEIIQSAVDANMNMLRVWGGGVYEDDQFYNLCDENGILVWQDFMFAGGMYPGDSLFVENIRQEATDNVMRLRSHPCIALWCGNNEVDEGWHNWGWQNQYKYSKKDSTAIWNDYLKIFQDVLPKVVEQNDPGRLYWPSSPSIGWGHPESLQQGDSHYWGVWWGKEPFEAYKTKVGRFMSEYGFQGMPSLTTFKKFCDAKDITPTSFAVKNHQKHPTGYETIQSYLEKEYKEPRDFEDLIYVSQLLQADGIKTAIEAHRRAKPFCMGTLYWQLNDCWPVTSWSSTDYYGEWKALHYTVKKAYQKYLVSPVVDNGKINVYVVSDGKKETNAFLEMKLLDLNGAAKWSKSFSVEILPDSSKIYYSVDSAEVLKTADPTKSVFSVKLIKDNSVLSENLLYFCLVKDLKITQPLVTYSFSLRGSQTILELDSKTFVKKVFIDFLDMKVKLSDNYFDLLPGEKKTVEVESNFTSGELTKKIKIKSLFDTF